MPPSFTRPTAKKEREALLKHLESQYGLIKLHYQSGVVSYHTPPYERNVLKMNGIRCIPANWRIGDILVVQKQKPGNEKRKFFPFLEESPSWDEISIGPIRIKIRHEKNQIDSYGIKLESIYPDDIYPSVKRSSRGKSVDINVWTSGNRVFRCSNPALLYFALLHAHTHCEQILLCFADRGLKLQSLSLLFHKEYLQITRDRNFLIKLLEKECCNVIAWDVLRYLKEADIDFNAYAELLFAVCKSLSNSTQNVFQYRIDDLISCVARLFRAGRDEPEVLRTCLDIWDNIYHMYPLSVQPLADLLDRS